MHQYIQHEQVNEYNTYILLFIDVNNKNIQNPKDFLPNMGIHVYPSSYVLSRRNSFTLGYSEYKYT